MIVQSPRTREERRVMHVGMFRECHTHVGRLTPHELLEDASPQQKA